MTTIYSKLNGIQVELNAPKNNFNNFGKYKYRSCEDILEAVKPLLKKYETTLTISDEINQIGDRYYIVATATLSDTKTGDTVQTTAYAREPENKKGMDSAQLTGATSSYARKYALNGLLAIDDSKDADTMDNRNQGQKQAVKQPRTQGKTGAYGQNHGDAVKGEMLINEAQLNKLIEIVKGYRIPASQMSKLLGQFGYEKSTQIKQKDLDKILTRVEEVGKNK